MAIQINSSGSRDGVLKFLGDYSVPDNSPEAAQLPAVKAFIVSEIGSLDSKFNGCHVVCQGTVEPGLRQVNVSVIGQTLHL
jgi:hypothetical protein